MNHSLALTPSINYALDRVLIGSRAVATPERASVPRPRLGVDLLGLLILILMLGVYLLAQLQ